MVNYCTERVIIVTENFSFEAVTEKPTIVSPQKNNKLCLIWSINICASCSVSSLGGMVRYQDRMTSCGAIRIDLWSKKKHFSFGENFFLFFDVVVHFRFYPRLEIPNKYSLYQYQPRIRQCMRPADMRYNPVLKTASTRKNMYNNII